MVLREIRSRNLVFFYLIGSWGHLRCSVSPIFDQVAEPPSSHSWDLFLTLEEDLYPLQTSQHRSRIRQFSASSLLHHLMTAGLLFSLNSILLPSRRNRWRLYQSRTYQTPFYLASTAICGNEFHILIISFLNVCLFILKLCPLILDSPTTGNILSISTLSSPFILRPFNNCPSGNGNTWKMWIFN